MDSGASEKVFSDIALSTSIGGIDFAEVGLDNGQKGRAWYKGCITVMFGNHTKLKLENAYIVPEPRLNLMSCYCLDKSGIATIIYSGFRIFYYKIKGNRFIVQVPVKTGDGLFAAELLNSHRNSDAGSMMSADMLKKHSQNNVKKEAKEAWHKRFRHPSQ